VTTPATDAPRFIYSRRLPWIASIGGALVAPVLTTPLATLGLLVYWLAVCYADDGICNDPSRILKWSVLHGVLVGAHGIVVGGVVGFVIAALRSRFARRRTAVLVGAGIGAGVGGMIGFELWFTMGNEAPLASAVIAHGLVGAAIASVVYERARIVR
jgi:hypothetical protein